MNGEFGVDETFESRAFDDDLLNGKIIRSGGKIDNFAEIGAFFGFDLEPEQIKIKIENFFNLNDVCLTDKFVGVVDDDAVLRIFANRRDVEDVGVYIYHWTGKEKTEDF